MKRISLLILAAFAMLTLSACGEVGADPSDTSSDGGTGSAGSPPATTAPPEEDPVKPKFDDAHAITALKGSSYDLVNSRFIYGKNMDSPTNPGGFAKLATALTALDALPETHEYTAGDELALIDPEEGYYSAALKSGMVLGQEAAMAGLIVGTCTDSAYMIAANAARHKLGADAKGKTPEELLSYFVDMMNAYVKTLGCKDTTFKNTNGDYDENAYSTVYDLTLIAAEVAKTPVLHQLLIQKTMVVDYISGEWMDFNWSRNNPYEDSISEGIIGLSCKRTGAGDEDYYFAAKCAVDGIDCIALVFEAKTDMARKNDIEALFLMAAKDYVPGAVGAHTPGSSDSSSSENAPDPDTDTNSGGATTTGSSEAPPASSSESGSSQAPDDDTFGELIE